MATEKIYNPSLNTQPPPRARTSTPNVIVLCGTLIALVMVGLCALVLYQGRVDALDRTRDTSRNLALIAERDIVRNFELYELSLQAVSKACSATGSHARCPPQLRTTCCSTARPLPSISNRCSCWTRRQYRRRFRQRRAAPGATSPTAHYFTAQRDNPDAGLYISDPLRFSLRIDMPSIVLSRRISHPDGSFARRRDDRDQPRLLPQSFRGAVARGARVGVGDRA